MTAFDQISSDPELQAGLRDLYATLRKGSVGARAMLRVGPIETREALASGQAP